MVFPGTSFFLGASDIHQRSNISSMRSFESRWGSKKGLCLGGYSDPLDMTGPSPPIRTGTLSDTARPNPSPTTEILPCGRPFLRDLLDSTVQGGNRLC